MKKYLAAFMALAMAATALTGCGGGDSAGGDDSNKTYKVAYIARAQSDSFAAWLANEMVAAADKYDDIELKVFDGQADDAKENAAIENAIAKPTPELKALKVHPLSMPILTIRHRLTLSWH